MPLNKETKPNQTYIGSNISSTEDDVNTRTGEAWTGVDRLSIIRKSDRFDKIQQGSVSTTVGIRYLNAKKTHGKKSRWEQHKNATLCFKHILDATPHKTAAVRPPAAHLKNY